MNTLQGDEAVRSLANNVDSYILGLYTGIYSQAGTAGTTPFASDLTDWTSGARSKLNTFKALMDDRAVVLDADAEGSAIGNRGLQDASWRGTTEGIVFGDIGYALGASWHLDQNVPTHTTGSPSSWLVNTASSSIGDTTVPIDTGSGTPAEGDIFTVAASTQQFVVVSYATSTITFQPA